MPYISVIFALGLITSFLATATATNASAPIAAATCYVDSCDKPSLPFLASKIPSQTVPGCIAECGAAGLAIPQTECNIPCTGDASSICGGGFRLSVYTVPASTIKTRTVRSNVRRSLEKRTCPGAPAPCYVDSCDNPALPFLSSKSPCKPSLAALRNVPPPTTNSQVSPGPTNAWLLPQTECNMPCAGDGGTICGGGFRLSLYTVPAHARRNYRPNFRRSLQKRTCPSSTSTLIGKPTVSAVWRR
ncbi:hypothetical protein B0H14DRAFT_2892562 [Mycena olivaceomarginata]|nr:hypothetical protein B0H14DRAFT_2892562 [Mycena olivaceomarginata]